MKTLAALNQSSRKVELAWKVNPHDKYVCCQCGKAMQVAFGDPLHFTHIGETCGGSKWLHDYAIQVLADKSIGKCFALPGAASGMHGRVESAPRAEIVIPNHKGKLSSARRVDVGMKACIHEHNHNHPIGHLVIEVTNTSGKDAAFVDDMKRLRISVCEFELGRMLHEQYPHRTKDKFVTAVINTWVNNGSHYKRWLHVEQPFRAAYDKWMRQRSYGRT